MKRGEKGFTLIEMLVTTAIMALVTACTSPMDSQRPVRPESGTCILRVAADPPEEGYVRPAGGDYESGDLSGRSGTLNLALQYSSGFPSL